MMGPIYSFRDADHLERIVEALESAGIHVDGDHADQGEGFELKRGSATLTASLWSNDGMEMLYLGFGHPFRPRFWTAESKLLRDAEQVLLAAGTKKVESEGETG